MRKVGPRRDNGEGSELWIAQRTDFKPRSERGENTVRTESHGGQELTRTDLDNNDEENGRKL